MVDLRQSNSSIITTKPDQLITITTQAGVTSQEDRRPRLGISSSPYGPQSSGLGCIERLVGQLGDGVGNRDWLRVIIDTSLHAHVRKAISFGRLGHDPGLSRYSCYLRIIS